ncbi:3-phenylpropionate/cinnamic acid dioxygenase subunit beta [Natrarchaeobius halalkaliphilus]|uniref:3-phenylpropionate/cinnamic acid dioxygenase subunit beta n=1 Tax=Natrarchaeobius halalkaliphilus TaxID=1679091 RepID=A0A3N6MRQ5_9EURY|nr:aromatic-ring-hydroxylating dioxygenase subunit beta [Natrarchaeobius halalkaliphilus]RQG86953.1 3-phenylpropionate/cinnamic acid dioxygenase subunit beta [Natrarchaeobius halalkaliphilus]
MNDDLVLTLECRQFLVNEAELLDDQRLHEWLDLLTDDVEYRVPRRVMRERGAEAAEFSDEGFLFRDDKGTLRTRVERYDKEYAWAENPPSRTRRIVGNVRVVEQTADDVTVKSNSIVYRSQGDESDHDLIAGERVDVLRRADEGFRLARRTVHLDQTVLATRNLSIFL